MDPDDPIITQNQQEIEDETQNDENSGTKRKRGTPKKITPEKIAPKSEILSELSDCEESASKRLKIVPEKDYVTSISKNFNEGNAVRFIIRRRKLKGKKDGVSTAKNMEEIVDTQNTSDFVPENDDEKGVTGSSCDENISKRKRDKNLAQKDSKLSDPNIGENQDSYDAENIKENCTIINSNETIFSDDALKNSCIKLDPEKINLSVKNLVNKEANLSVAQFSLLQVQKCDSNDPEMVSENVFLETDNENINYEFISGDVNVNEAQISINVPKILPENIVTLTKNQIESSENNINIISDEKITNEGNIGYIVPKKTILLTKRDVTDDSEEVSNETLIISDDEQQKSNDCENEISFKQNYITVKNLKLISDATYYNTEENSIPVEENETQLQKSIIKIEDNVKQIDISTIISNSSDSDENPSKRRRLPVRRERAARSGLKKKLKPKPEKLITTHKLKTDEVNQIQITMATTEKMPEKKTPGSAKIKSEMLKNLFHTGKITYRVMKRANFVIQTVRQEKVIVDLTKLMKLIKEEEIGEGYKAAIDKKSLMRLILKLSRDGYIKFRKATLKSDLKQKTVCFICDPNIEDDHSVIISALEQSKMKFFIGTKDKLKDEPTIIEEKDLPFDSKGMVKSVVFNSESDMLMEDTKEDFKYTYNRTASKTYGLCPKFVRTRIMHEILYYLIYEESNKVPITDREEIEKVFQSHGVQDDVFEKDLFCPLYSRDLNWKMFVPPLPVHTGWPKGWTLICDVLLRLPLVIFLKCFNVPYVIPDIELYINHPIRKFLLVKNLPPKVRNGIMHGRRYIFSMHELASRLCHMGLLQFGPQKLKEKDQIFLYLNKRASLYNTVTSSARYHQTEVKDYEKHDYVFKSFHDLEIYWYELWTICINTQLGTRISMAGQFIVLEQANTKPILLEAVKPKLADEVEKYDNGDIPGDRRGAAGLDSALFAHLKRNWNWSDLLTYPEKEILKNKNKPAAKPKEKPAVEAKKDVVEEKIVEKRAVEANKIKPKKFKVKKREAKRKKIIRQVLPIKQIKIKKTWYDEKDKLCLKKMSKLRTDWTQIEDNVLLLCTVASIYLCPNRRKQNVEYTVMRDVLHKHVPYANDKTSRSCQRRIAYIMKNIKTRRSVHMCLEEIRQCEYVIEKFGTIVKKYHGVALPLLTLNIAFIELVVYLNQKFSNQIQTIRKPLPELPDTIDSIKRLYEFNMNKKVVTTIFKDVENIHDIHFDVIRSVIHSSMSCIKDKSSWAFELFKIYQQYPEALLRSVIMKIRHDQMVSVKKSFLKVTGSGCIPFSTPYQLSISYAYQLQNLRFHYNSYIEANVFLRDILNWMQNISDNKMYEITCSDNGTSMLILDIMNKMNVEFVFEHPEQIIVLDPIITSDSMYESIIKRYNDILNDPSRISLWEEKQKENDTADSDEENYPKFEETKTVDVNSSVYKRTSTRIAFHMMRAEMCEGIDKNGTQHLHDYFVVNASRVFFKISEKTDNQSDYDLSEMQIKNGVLKVLEKIKSDAIVPDICGRITSENIRNHFNKQLTDYDFEYIEKIKCFIWESGEIGAKISCLKNIPPDSKNVILNISDVLQVLLKFKIIYRVGVTVPRFIHFDHKAPWIVNSDKIVRLEKEKIIPKDIKGIKMKGKRLIKSLPENNTEGNEHQKVKLLMAPWIRLNGSLNRRVLDRWIGSVLSYIMEDPGISLTDLSTRFDYLKPVELMAIIENLAELKFVKLIKIQKPKVTLFSKELDFDFEEADMCDEPKNILIEPAQDAVYKFALFLGQKSYDCNFID